MPEPSLKVRIQAVLFVASEPLSAARLAEATHSGVGEVEQALSELLAATKNDGICLSVATGQYRLVSSPEAADTVRKFLQDESNTELSRAALETLAIVAYRGPLTKAKIEAIRGVASDTMLRNLLARGLVVEAGKSTEPGHPVNYTVTHAFLQHFGLTGTHELPAIPEAEE